MNLREILKDAKEQLALSEIDGVDAEILLAHVLGISRMDLHNPVLLERTLEALDDKSIPLETFHDLLARRILHEPLQYITGTAYFRNLELKVGPGVLVPRPESELLVGAVLTHIANLPAPVSVIDLGSGSGALALAIATEASNSRVIAVEKSDEALVWLKKNVETIVEDLRIVHSDVNDALPGIKCDVVIANPPYIEDESDLPRDVVEHEPAIALFGGKDGMDAPRQFISSASRLLKSGGLLAIEHNEKQGTFIKDALSADFEEIQLHQDLAGRPRWTSAIRKNT
ncbi:MAG: peptide chain release factor N(5)-glutamine methyltransferase [Actinobacteria bacterium]|nr:peptide chain release factor N(5)-glutamine methyltransferase [Actinomycetota bacterium]NDA95187.1 peptide chain release factor N(5)-glutamine methyltransferase [Actinomycetota bacterium]NDH80806.1 peptide chain release factor N(5)-glutamine methyltransferase [Actinomycetota bacterium]NDH99165.1 peptide chain release factor N(5)-glutamine methyltransferase [Actinomycetota bacterium]